MRGGVFCYFFLFLFFFYNPHQYLSLFCVSMLPGVKKMLTIKILATLSGGKGELSSYLSEMKYEISVYYVNSLNPRSLYLPYNSYSVSWEDLVLNQLIIP